MCVSVHVWYVFMCLCVVYACILWYVWVCVVDVCECVVCGVFVSVWCVCVCNRCEHVCLCMVCVSVFSVCVWCIYVCCVYVCVMWVWVVSVCLCVCVPGWGRMGSEGCGLLGLTVMWSGSKPIFLAGESGVWVWGNRCLLTLSKMDNFLFFFSFCVLFLDDFQEEKEVGIS